MLQDSLYVTDCYFAPASHRHTSLQHNWSPKGTGGSLQKVGAFIRKGREKKGLTQERFSEMIGCNSTYYGNIERGINSPSLKLFLRMVSYLSLSVDKFVQQNEVVETDTYQQLLRIMADCTETELKILLENAQTLLKHRTDAPENNTTL